MSDQLDITNIITGKQKKTNIKNLTRKEITAYAANPRMKFCYECGDYNPIQTLFVEVFATNLYGYICTDCNFKGMVS